MPFQLAEAVPELLRKEIEWADQNAPEISEQIPPVVAADPGWTRQYQNVLRSWKWGAQRAESRGSSSSERRRVVAEYWANLGHLEFDLIVKGCSFAATHYEMPVPWRMCLLKQGHDDMNHAAGYIARACRIADEDMWEPRDPGYRRRIAAYGPILERDLGGFFAAVGLHTEAYPAWTNLSGGAPLRDPNLVAWSLREVEEEAWHLTFLFPAIHQYLHSGTGDAQDRKKRQMVRDNELLLETVLHPAHANAREYAVGRLGMDASVLWGYERVDERTRYILHKIGIEESYWPAYLRASGAESRPAKSSA